MGRGRKRAATGTSVRCHAGGEKIQSRSEEPHQPVEPFLAERVPAVSEVWVLEMLVQEMFAEQELNCLCPGLGYGPLPMHVLCLCYSDQQLQELGSVEEEIPACRRADHPAG